MGRPGGVSTPTWEVGGSTFEEAQQLAEKIPLAQETPKKKFGLKKHPGEYGKGWRVRSPHPPEVVWGLSPTGRGIKSYNKKKPLIFAHELFVTVSVSLKDLSHTDAVHTLLKSCTLPCLAVS